MKKIVLILSVAALALASCVKTSDVYTGSPDSRQIAFSPLAQPATKAAIQGTTFPTGNTMEVRAYQAAPTAAEYFAKTTFSYNSTYWAGSQYWPLSPATINFFALSGAGVAAADMTIANALASATVEYKTTGNTSTGTYSETSQSDIMYAFNRASVTQSGNTLSFPTQVDMAFKHALAQVNFQIKAADPASTAISIKKIELNKASYTGELAITNTNAADPSATFSAQLDWTADPEVASVQVPNIGDTSSPIALTTSFVPDNSTTWAALMIIPSQQTQTNPVSYGFESFTIYYQLGGRDYSYTYVPGGFSNSDPVATAVQAGMKYTYQISMQLHEISINASVTPWDDTNNVHSVNI